MSGETPAAAALPIISPQPWRWVRGHALGFAQPTLHPRLWIRAVDAQALARADEALTGWLGALPEPGGRTPAEQLASRVVLASLALQRDLGEAVPTHYRLLLAGTSGESATVDVVMPAPDAGAARLTLESAIGFLNAQLAPAAAGDAPAGEDPKLTWTKRRAGWLQLRPHGQNLPFLLEAALQQGLPVQRLAPQTIRLGWGSRQRIFCSTMTDRTTSVGSILARDKLASARLLRSVGMPGGHNEEVFDADRAVVTARRFGYPVVVKPKDRDGGIGVAADLRDDESVRQAFAEARRHSNHVLVERHVDGQGHRLTVAHGRLIKATAKLPWGVTGDGRSPLSELLDAEKKRRLEQESRTPPPQMDDEALGMLRQQGLTLDSVVDEGRFVALRRRNNAVAGGTTKRLELDTVHPDNVQLALRATDALLLDVAGVDLIVADITRSWTSQAALICEVNAQPQLDARTLAELLRDTVGDGGVRVPVWLVLLHAAEARVEPAHAARWARQLRVGAWATSEAACIGEQPLQFIEGQPLAPGAAVLASRQVDSALLIWPTSLLQQHGLPVDRIAGAWAANDAAGIDRLLLASRFAAPDTPALLTDNALPQPVAARLRTLIGQHLQLI